MSIKTLIAPGETQSRLAADFRRARLEKGHSREKAERLTGVPVSTIRKFESAGQISFRQFIMLCHGYGNLTGLAAAAFPEKAPSSLDELMADERPQRQRGRTV